jgi:hypothetical protein
MAADITAIVASTLVATAMVEGMDTVAAMSPMDAADIAAATLAEDSMAAVEVSTVVAAVMAAADTAN